MPKVGGVDKLLRSLDKQSDHVDLQKQFQRLNLTGDIISVTAHIPYIVGITKYGKFELTPRPGKSVLRDTLSHLSSSRDWNHTLVGWTGEILPARGLQFSELLRERELPSSSTPGESGQLGNVVIHNLAGSAFNSKFLKHWNGDNQAQREVLITKDDRRGLETLLEHAFQDTIVPVWLGDWSKSDKDTLLLGDQTRWHQYAEQELNQGPQQYTSELGSARDTHRTFLDYKQMNEAMADGIVKVYKPGDVIWVHDYHLMLLPEILRKKLPTAYIAYFQYSDWTSNEPITRLANPEEVMKGILAASTVGVPNDGLRQYMENYLRQNLRLTVAEDDIVGAAGRHTSLVHVPVGIDVAGVRAAAYEDKEVEQHMSKIRQTYKEKQIIVARARLDHGTETSFLLDDFTALLVHNPDLRQKVVLFLLTVHEGVQDITGTSRKEQIDANVASYITNINAEFGSCTHQPLICLARDLPAPEYFALLRLSDLCIVTSNHDSLNAISMEHVICQQEKHSPLLISEPLLTGDVLKAPKLTELAPKRIEGTIMSIHDGLLLSDDEKARKHKVLYDYFTEHNVATFTQQFLSKACASFLNQNPAVPLPCIDLKVLKSSYNTASKRLFMFDYDGTLTPIVNDPDAAVPTEQLLSSLKKLSSTAENRVWIVSGRSRMFLEEQFGSIEGVGLSAEHGCFVRRPGSDDWENLAATMDMGWKLKVEEVFGQLVKEVSGSWIERKEVAMVWHYRNATDHDTCLAKAVESKALLEGERLKGWDVEIMLGKANVEVRPRFLNKGVMAASLVKEVFGEDQKGFVVCAGDDTTDEDMFRALLASKLKEGIFTCLVSKEGKPSLAYYQVNEPINLVDAISLLVNK